MGCVFFSFFFQAEDGIRDSPVTGVQTCALPIWVGNIWVYRIREDGETKVKTLSSERDIPFHPTLWNTLGFGKFYRKSKDKGYEREIGRASCRERV